MAVPIAVQAPQLTYHEYISQDFGLAAPVAEAIVKAESGGRSWATHLNNDGTTDYGLFQVNSIHAKRVSGNLSALLDPKTNVQIAAQIFREQGFKPWTTFTTGKYKEYLK